MIFLFLYFLSRTHRTLKRPTMKHAIAKRPAIHLLPSPEQLKARRIIACSRPNAKWQPSGIMRLMSSPEPNTGSRVYRLHRVSRSGAKRPSGIISTVTSPLGFDTLLHFAEKLLNQRLPCDRWKSYVTLLVSQPGTFGQSRARWAGIVYQVAVGEGREARKSRRLVIKEVEGDFPPPWMGEESFIRPPS